MEETKKYAEALEDMLTALDLKFDKIEQDDSTVFELVMTTENAPALKTLIIISDDSTFKIYSVLARDVKASKTDLLLRMLNELNRRYKYINLFLDRENDIVADYTGILLVDEEKAAKIVFAVFYIMLDIMDECIPPIMKLLWSDDPDEQPATVKIDLFDMEGEDEE